MSGACAGPRALIVAHGQPSDPGPAEAALAGFAARVAAALPGWSIGSATLAAPGAIAAALAERSAPGEPGPEAGPLLVYPMFMADGWFTRTALPARLREAGLEVVAAGEDPARPPGARMARVLRPFGLEAGLLDLACGELDAALERFGWAAAETSLLLAAHGSFKSRAPAAVARGFARRLIARRRLATVQTAFIDQEPRLADWQGPVARHALCLPFFAAAGGHVEEDLPAALAEAGFPGPILPPLGISAHAPALVAASLAGGQGRG